MAYIEEITPRNIEVFGTLIPDIIKTDSLEEEGYRFYGITQDDVAQGVVVLREMGELLDIKFLYIVQSVRGSGTMDYMLALLFIRLREEGFKFARLRYLPTAYPSIDAISKRFGFSEEKLQSTYFKFKAEDVKRSRASSFEPQGIIRFKYLPPEKKKHLFKMIEKSYVFQELGLIENQEVLPYSIAYMENDEPKGAIVIQAPDVNTSMATDDVRGFPEIGAYDMTLFFVGSLQQKAPLYLLSALCRMLQNEFPDNVTITGYFPEGHVSRLIEGTLGIRGKKEVSAVLDLETLKTEPV